MNSIIAWVDIVGDGSGSSWNPLDAGILVTKTALEDYQVLGYGGWTIEHPDYDLYKEDHPAIALVNEALPPRSVDKVDDDMEDFLSNYLDDKPHVVLAHRCGTDKIAAFLPNTYSLMNSEFPIRNIQGVMGFLGIPSNYVYPDIFPEDFPERAVGRSLYHHAEAQIYSNNIRAWGNEALQNMVDDLIASEVQ